MGGIAEGIMRIVVQIGYQKARGRRRQGQLVRAYHNDLELSWSSFSCAEGKYLTAKSDAQKGFLWYLCDLDLEDSEVLKLEAKTSILGAGVDEQKTFEALYVVNHDAPVREIFVPGVGFKGYPLLKGRILEMGSVSAADNRKLEIDSFLREGF